MNLILGEPRDVRREVEQEQDRLARVRIKIRMRFDSRVPCDAKNRFAPPVQYILYPGQMYLNNNMN